MADLDVSRTKAAERAAPAGGTTWLTTFRARADRVVAIARIILAVGSLYIAWIDTAHPGDESRYAPPLLVGYLVYAIATAIVFWHASTGGTRGPLIRHVVDVVWFMSVLFLTDGPISPFFMFTPFALLTATLHWQWRGALITGVVCFLGIAVLIATETDRVLDLDAEATTGVSRLVFVFVTAALLVWIGVEQEIGRSELLRLAVRSPALPSGAEWPYAEAVDYAASVLDAPGAALVWSDAEEPWTHVAVLDKGRLRLTRHGPDDFSPWVAEPFEESSFLVSGAQGRVSVHVGAGRFRTVDGNPLHPDLAARLALSSAVSVPFVAGDIHARLFVLNAPAFSPHQVAVVEIAADRIRLMFQQTVLTRKLSDKAALEQRVKIARDLHDGVLQALAGTVLQLNSLKAMARTDPDQLAARIDEIQALIAGEQRDLRSFIHALRPAAGGPENPGAELVQRFDRLAGQLRRRWDVRIAIRVAPPDMTLPEHLADELERLIAEATANAVRHGRANTVIAGIRLSGRALKVGIEDNGCGFGFPRRMEHSDLEGTRSGPRSLRERTAGLGGRLAVDRQRGWTLLEIQIPLVEARA